MHCVRDDYLYVFETQNHSYNPIFGEKSPSIWKVSSEKSNSYRDLIKEIVVYDDVVNTIEIDLIKLDVNLERINRIEIIKLLDYSIQVTLYDNNKLLSRINSTIPSSWLDKLELKSDFVDFFSIDLLNTNFLLHYNHF